MSFHIFMKEKKYIKLFLTFICFSVFDVSFADWKIDLSRRSKHLQVPNYIEVIPKEEKKQVFEYYRTNQHPIQDLVIMNTAKGFVPEAVRLRVGIQYRVHLVNVDKETMNASFVLPSFSQYHSTYFGKTKSFIIHPKKEGVHSFESPESKSKGKLIVHNETIGPKAPKKSKERRFEQLSFDRGLASEPEEVR